jgi:PAS domain S-box-containing protein
MRPIGKYVLLLGLVGVASVSAAYWISDHIPPPSGIPESEPWLVALFVVLTYLGQVTYVRVRHDGTTEELNFLEAAIAAALLSLGAHQVLLAGLVGISLAELHLRRREPLKVAFNVGSWATSASAMLVLYYVLAQGQYVFSLTSIVAMTISGLAFAALNLAALAHLMQVNGGLPRSTTVRSEWQLSAIIALGGVGLGMSAIALIEVSPALLPFAFLPALALWYAYRAAADRADAQERNLWLLALGGALAKQGQSATLLAETGEAIRRIVRAPEIAIVSPTDEQGADTRTAATLAAVRSESGPRALTEDELPDGWRNGVLIRLDLDEPGALLLGSTQPYRPSRIAERSSGWSLDPTDKAVLAALVAAVGSAMRAGAAFGALKEERDKLTAVVDNTSDGIAMIDDAGEVRLWSRTMARMTGVEADPISWHVDGAPEIVQTLINASRHPETRPDGTPAPVRETLVRADGEEVEVIISTVRVREATPQSNSDASGWVRILTVHDETRERKVARMKSVFVATISHELKTPITPIKGYAHLLATRGDRIPVEKRTQWAQVISERADHMARLVEDLLLVSLASKVSDGTPLDVEMGVADLDDVIGQALSNFEQLTERITVELPEHPVAIQCDRDRAEQCLSNLLSNAEKYTPGDSPITIRAEVTGTQVHIHVRDRGPGIPASEQARVFDQFYRREDPFTMRTGGAGLGLHIARELAVAMGGGLTLQTPTAGPGAEFVLHLVTVDGPEVIVAQAARPNRHPGVSPATPPPIEGPVSAHSPAGDDTMDQPQDSRLAAM